MTQSEAKDQARLVALDLAVRLLIGDFSARNPAMALEHADRTDAAAAIATSAEVGDELRRLAGLLRG